jgi:hypothetical protein
MEEPLDLLSTQYPFLQGQPNYAQLPGPVGTRSGELSGFITAPSRMASCRGAGRTDWKVPDITLDTRSWLTHYSDVAALKFAGQPRHSGSLPQPIGPDAGAKRNDSSVRTPNAIFFQRPFGESIVVGLGQIDLRSFQGGLEN